VLKNHFRIILIICLISSLGRFVLDSYLPSLPAIGRQFNIPDSWTQLTLTIYLMGFGVSQLIYGPLSDYYGRRVVILVGLLIFLLGTLVCGLATSPAALFMSRLVAGIGAGACGVLNRAIASDCFKGAEFSKAWSYTTTTLVLTLMVAPILGGCIQDAFGWRANFFLATFYVVMVLIVIFRFLPETHLHIAKNSLKIWSVFKTYYQILNSHTFIMSALCYTLVFSGLIIYFQVSPLLLMSKFSLSPTQYGYSSLLIAGSYLVGGLIVNRWSHCVSVRHFLFIGTSLLILAGATMLLAYFLHRINLSSILIPSAIFVVGTRIVIPNAMACSMEEFRHLGGSSSALIGCIQMLGSSLVSAIMANFSYESPVPLAFFFTMLGMLSLTVSMYINPKNAA
jgi:Bcr/CflA subfamily drug resistance transporter